VFNLANLAGKIKWNLASHDPSQCELCTRLQRPFGKGCSPFFQASGGLAKRCSQTHLVGGAFRGRLIQQHAQPVHDDYAVELQKMVGPGFHGRLVLLSALQQAAERCFQ